MLKTISIQNYRNLKNLNLDVSPKINLLVATNGSGKTNLLEVIYYSIFGESFRPISGNFELLGNQDELLKIVLEFDFDKLQLVVEKNNRRFILNNKKIFLSKIAPRFPIIVFAPQSVDLVSREPSLRRQDLDHFLSILDPKYKSLLSKYKTLLRNRNSLIKMIRENKATRTDLEFWTNNLVEVAEEIFKTRVKFFQEIKIQMKKTVDLLGEYFENDEFNSLDVNYISSLEGVVEENFKFILKNKFDDNLEKEIVVGKTLYGIHKDDFQVLLHNKNLRFLGSRGQQRIGILLFKLAEAFYLETKLSIMPLILLDDLMSELDSNNRSKVSSILLKIDAQIFMTTADENEIPGILRSEATLLSIF